MVINKIPGRFVRPPGGFPDHDPKSIAMIPLHCGKVIDGLYITGTHGRKVSMQLQFEVVGMDFMTAGKAAARIRKTLQQIGLGSRTIRRVSVIAYEAEMNIVIHAQSGMITVDVRPDSVHVIARDRGPGIPDVERAMSDGYSTAPDHVREMGFGAGMGLPNIRRHASSLEIESEVGEGTCLTAVVNFGSEEGR